MPIPLNLKAVFARSGIATMLAAFALGAQTTPSQPTRLPCIRVNEIGSDMYKPFTAQLMTKSLNRLPDGTQRQTEQIEFVARDSAGRIRIERNGGSLARDTSERITLHTRDGNTIQTTKQELGRAVAIQDCYTGKALPCNPGCGLHASTVETPRASVRKL
jgi:hypothetical protein